MWKSLFFVSPMIDWNGENLGCYDPKWFARLTPIPAH